MAKFFAQAKPVNGNVYEQSGVDRLSFLKKVYGYFSFSLIITGIGGYVGFKFVIGMLQRGTGRNIYSIMIILAIVELVALAITWFVRKKDPINKIMLAVYSFLSGFTLGPLLAIAVLMAMGKGMAAGTLVLQALIITFLVFVGLTSYVFISKKDFSFMGGALMIGLFVLIGMGLMGLIFGFGRPMAILYSGAGALIFAGFMLYDTSMIMRRYTHDEYIAGAINLQLDFVLLFMHILRLIMILQDR